MPSVVVLGPPSSGVSAVVCRSSVHLCSGVKELSLNRGCFVAMTSGETDYNQITSLSSRP